MDSSRTRTFDWDDPLGTAAAAAGQTGLAFLEEVAAGRIPAPPIARTLDFRLERVTRGEAVFTLEPAEYHFNPIGSVHGGVYATLLDSAAGCAVHSMLAADVGYTSLDLAVRFIAPMRPGSGPVTATGTVQHLGRRTAVAEAKLVDGTGRLLATATSTCLILS
jgi:uncharacterized protein (TIGR00369 family)